MLRSVGTNAVAVGVHSHDWQKKWRNCSALGKDLEIRSSANDLEWRIYSIYA